MIDPAAHVAPAGPAAPAGDGTAAPSPVAGAAASARPGFVQTVGWHYTEAHERLDGLLRALEGEAWEASVPT